MARPGDGEPSLSVLERLLANAALRDEAGWLRSPEPRAPPPAGVSQGVWGGVGCRSRLGLFAGAGGGCPFCLPGGQAGRRARTERSYRGGLGRRVLSLGRKWLGTHEG